MLKNQRIMLFVSFSLITGLVYLVFLYLMQDIIHANLVVSVTIAYSMAMVFYFLINKYVVFNAFNDNQPAKTIFQYIIMLTCNYLLTLFIVAVVRRITNEAYLGSLFAGIVTITLTYYVFDWVLFKKHDDVQRDAE